jgi:hypothetical protein
MIAFKRIELQTPTQGTRSKGNAVDISGQYGDTLTVPRLDYGGRTITSTGWKIKDSPRK